MDIQQLASSFQCVNFCHVCRDDNRVAYVLARKILDLHFDFLVWPEDVSGFLEHVILQV
jgi:hypothetical protein